MAVSEKLIYSWYRLTVVSVSAHRVSSKKAQHAVSARTSPLGHQGQTELPRICDFPQRLSTSFKWGAERRGKLPASFNVFQAVRGVKARGVLWNLLERC